MKHNPRLNEKMARLPGFADLHPLQPVSTVQGALELIDTLAHWLKTLTGMPAVALSPAAGAHGELCGIMAIRAAPGGPRRGPSQAHPGAGIGAWHQPGDGGGVRLHGRRDPGRRRDGRVDLAALKAKLGPDVAAIMLTNPNTCGLFESDIIEIAEAVHEAGAYFYCDGANFNAIVGRVRPGDLGIDAMHINLHKTFSTPAWRRRAGRRPGGAVGGAGALRADAGRGARRRRLPPRRACRPHGRAAAQLRPAEGLPRPDGHVRPRAGLHDEPRRRRAAPGGRAMRC